MSSPMWRESLVPLITFIGSGVAAGFAWWQAVRTAKLNTSASQTIEQMKLDADRRRRAMEAAFLDAKPVETALDGAWRDIQLFKDAAASRLSASVNDSFSSARLRKSLERLAEGYREWGSRLPPEAQMAWHSARNNCDVVVELLSREGSPAETDSQTLRDLRQALTDKQMVLTRERSALRRQLTETQMGLL